MGRRAALAFDGVYYPPSGIGAPVVQRSVAHIGATILPVTIRYSCPPIFRATGRRAKARSASEASTGLPAPLGHLAHGGEIQPLRFT